MVPYIVDLLHDDVAIVRAAALRTLMQVLMLVTVITPSNAAIFPEYIIPAIAHLVRDPEVLVRCMYAQIIVPLADTAVRYLEMGQALKAHGTYKLSPDAQEYDEAHFEVRMILCNAYSSVGLTTALVPGIVRREYGGSSEQHPGAPLDTSCRSVQCSQAGGATQHFLAMYIPWPTEDERCPAQPHDHIFE